MPKRQPSPSLSRPAYPRKRAVQACQTCRQRRTKCDNEQPACTSCRNLGVECNYRTKDKSTFDAASLAILQRLDDLEALLRSKSLDSTANLTAALPHSPRVYQETDLASPTLARTQSSVHYRMNIESILSWAIFDQRGFEQCVDLNSLLLSYPLNLTTSRMLTTSDFETEAASGLLQAFLETIHIYNPILVIEKVQADMAELLLNGIGWDAKSSLLLLIFALGTITTPFGMVSPETHSIRKSDHFQQAEAFFLAAQKRLWTCMSSESFVNAQCFFLAGVYLMTTLRPIEAWRMFVQALACCHCVPNNHGNDTTDSEQTQLRNSIYWTCFKSELELRLELGIGKDAFLDLTYPAFFPSPPTSLLSHGEPSWYYYLAEIALRRLGNRILNFVYQHDRLKTSTADIIDSVHQFEEQASSWQESLPGILKLDNNDDETREDDASHRALRFILKGHLLDCYEMMYWPFMVDAIQGNMRPGQEARDLARKGFEICVQRINENEGGFFYRHHGTWLMLRSCTRSALVLLGACLAGLSNLLDSSWATSVAKVIRMLKFWDKDTADVAHYLNVLSNLMSEVPVEI
ncbi:uncharacterized protein PV09_03112 [Verruconis gallopava]|uniref:Zn(2)-C6 fungal-type domain-containing protein n=1 Tax=Verruconis gallopava TaxID=253628 RepID=A0A0D2B3V7_9PEZI|nr:uncharacterized protein PV09_03112 [Verruconis gallopava]KIW05919.1 hypothetical protein PV09_03112 [Verruconis gallopava]